MTATLLAAKDRVELAERDVRRAMRDAHRRGVKLPQLAPEVLRAKSFLRYWRAVESNRALDAKAQREAARRVAHEQDGAVV